MSTEGEDPPEPGDVRIGEHGLVEVFDGETWGRYRVLPESGSAPILRRNDLTGADEAR
jgi:hypothetical protein